MINTLDALNAPYGPGAPSMDHFPLAAPVSDVTLGPPGRAYLVLTNGTVSVTTGEGTDRTFTAMAGMAITTVITHVLAGTSSDLLIFQR